LFSEKIFDWGKYLAARNAYVVPEDFFLHVSNNILVCLNDEVKRFEIHGHLLLSDRQIV